MISIEAMEAINKYFPKESEELIEKGIEKGYKLAMKEGSAKIYFTTIRRMKNLGYSIKEISQVTGLRMKGIKKL